jgi:hypothetical protein
MKKILPTAIVAAAGLLGCALPVRATTNVYFNASQTATVTASNMTAVTIHSGGYLFTYSQDGYFTGGLGGGPTGRFFTVLWPNGVQAQAYTAGPLSGSGANLTIKRADGKLFDLQSFTGRILLNTAGAGGAFEVTPQLNGNDAPGSPWQYDCTGYAGMSFPYAPSFVGYDAYSIHMWGDFALTALTLTDTNPVVPVSTITNTITASVSPVGAGTVGGAGGYPSNSVCTLTASPNGGWGFKNWTQNGTQVSSSAAYTFTVRSNRTLVANFIAAYTVTTAVAPSYGGSAAGGGMFNVSGKGGAVYAARNPLVDSRDEASSCSQFHCQCQRNCQARCAVPGERTRTESLCPGSGFAAGAIALLDLPAASPSV